MKMHLFGNLHIFLTVYLLKKTQNKILMKKKSETILKNL